MIKNSVQRQLVEQIDWKEAKSSHAMEEERVQHFIDLYYEGEIVRANTLF